MVATAKTDIRKLDLPDIEAYFERLGEPKFRAKQTWRWLWNNGVQSFDEMTNLSLNLREQLAKDFEFKPSTIVDEQLSNDGTVKVAFALSDGNIVEGVLIPAEDRMTVCISSQVGCSLTCAFCATGKLKRMRNLEAYEIVDHVRAIEDIAQRYYEKGLSNIVFMGMGEPLLNYKNVLRSIEQITNEDGMGWSPKRITLSTAGVGKMIRKLGDEGRKVKLALSLHATNDSKRSSIMPINDQNTLDELVESLNYYYTQTGLPITFEYILLKDFNDSLQDAAELVEIGRRVPSKVNLIEYNPIDDEEFERTPAARADAFNRYLNQNGLTATLRRSRGKDIDAACGQLANKNKGV